MSKEFKCEREVELPASPEQVWDAVATTEGLAAWLFPMPIPKPGEGTTIWDPPRHLAVRMEQGDWFNALEYVIEGRSGSSILRYVHHGIFVDDWETQFDAVQQHTDFYLHTLGQYLEFFDGRNVTFIGDVPGGIQGPSSSMEPEGFNRLKRALGLGSALQAGTPVRLEATGLDGVDGVVDYAEPNFLGVRTKDALYCFFGRNAFGQSVGMTIHIFGDCPNGGVVTSHWQQWLTGVFDGE